MRESVRKDCRGSNGRTIPFEEKRVAPSHAYVRAHRWFLRFFASQQTFEGGGFSQNGLSVAAESLRVSPKTRVGKSSTQRLGRGCAGSQGAARLERDLSRGEAASGRGCCPLRAGRESQARFMRTGASMLMGDSTVLRCLSFFDSLSKLLILNLGPVCPCGLEIQE